MKRRQLLAAGCGVFLPGCTYAHAGGELRETIGIPAPGSGENGLLFSRVDDAYATARAGMQWMRDEDGRMTFDAGTSVTIATRDGDVIWRFNSFESAEALAVGDRTFLRTEEEILASEAIELAERPITSRDANTTVAWTTSHDGFTGPMDATGDTAVLTRHNELIGLQDGEDGWEIELTSPVRSIESWKAGFLVRTPDRLYRIAPDGTRVWDREIAQGTGTVRIGGPGIALHSNGSLSLIGTDSDAPRWYESVSTIQAINVVSPAGVLVDTGDEITRYDIESGSPTGTFPYSAGSNDIVVPGPDAVFVSEPGGSVTAVDADGIIWTRELDVEMTTAPLDGWVEDETVAVLLDDGDIHHLHRAESGRPLLW